MHGRGGVVDGDGQIARDYLIKRGLDESVIDKFELGYNLDQDQATRFLLAKGHSLEHCVKANLTRTNEYGNKDVFAKRIVFPIHSPDGKPITATEFLKTLYGSIPDLFHSEEDLKTQWSVPATRKSLLETHHSP